MLIIINKYAPMEPKATLVRIDKGPFYKKFLTNPFKYYRRAGTMTFCLVAASNFFTTLMRISDSDGSRRQFLTEHPQLYFMALLGKSTYFGILWPSFYAEACSKPRNAFVLGAAVEEGLKNLE